MGNMPFPITATNQDEMNVQVSELMRQLWEENETIHAEDGPTFDRIRLASGQVAFPATAAPSPDHYTLDDYREGNWTPTAPATTTYTTQEGAYTKIGRMVFFSANLIINDYTPPDPCYTVGGLPYKCNATYPGHVNVIVNADIAPSFYSIYGTIAPGGNSIVIYPMTSAGNAITTTLTSWIKDGAALYLTGFYIATI